MRRVLTSPAKAPTDWVNHPADRGLCPGGAAVRLCLPSGHAPGHLQQDRPTARRSPAAAANGAGELIPGATPESVYGKAHVGAENGDLMTQSNWHATPAVLLGGEATRCSALPCEVVIRVLFK